ncbi:LysR family transcriptional regulator [Bdellovibrio sp. SKB1291214]|uniref:LysR family transcriptional regulator n=1 Tax=Bdellovibrio sp. SKB1291214 TaxID=1732569 RepID=UPI000B514D0E|nr:LysR family transcriptional regulator [Bdellovibrio sp. SKB1291214]UYL08592.1 LysR family transcriptional regulator [Bdellovibrio sp. SKB1291214]
MFNFNHLYYFYVTAKIGGVSNAAKYLRISQPSLSSQLKILESNIEVKLFEKKGRVLQLTPDGEKAFVYAKRMFDIAGEFAESLKSPGEKMTERFHVGVSEQVERPFIADLLSPVIRDNRGKTSKIMSITSAPDEDIVQMLRTKEADLMLTNKPIYADDVVELASVGAPVNLMVSTQLLKSLKIRVSRNTSIQEFLSAFPGGLVIPTYKMKLRHETDLFFETSKVRKKISFESDILSVVGRAIVDGAGCGFLPLPYLLEEIKLGLVTVIGPKSGYWKHSLYMISHKEDDYDDLTKDIVKRFKQLDKWS